MNYQEQILKLIDEVAKLPTEDRNEVFRNILNKLSTISYYDNECEHGVKYGTICEACETEAYYYYKSRSGCGEDCGGCENCTDINWENI